MGSIYEIERAHLQVGQDRLQLERVRNIHSSLVDINTNMQMLFAAVCNIIGDIYRKTSYPCMHDTL